MQKKFLKIVSFTMAMLMTFQTPITLFADSKVVDSIGSANMEDDGVSIGVDKTQEQKTTYSEEITNESLDTSNNKTLVYISQASSFGVFIPKTIVLSGQDKNASYLVNVKGNIGGLETISVEPEETFTLSQFGKNDIVANVSQDKVSWKYNEFETQGNGEIFANDMTAGSWSGKFNFNISLNGDLTNSVSSIKVVAKDENGNDLNVSASEIIGKEKETLLNELVDGGFINDSKEVDALIEVTSNDFDNLANTTFDVSNIANPGDVVVVYHYNETTNEWEYITTKVVEENKTIEAIFTSFSPIALEVNEACDNCSISEWKVLKETTVYQHGQEQGVCSVCHKINEKVIAKLEPTQLTFNPIQELSSGSDTTTSSVTVRYNENARMVSTSKMGTCLSCKKTHAVYNMRCNICGSKSDYNVYQSTVPTGSYYQYSCSCGQIMQGSSIPKHTCIQTEKKYYTITFNANIEYPKNSNGESPTTAIGSNASKNVYYGSTNTTTTIPTWVGYETGKWLTTTTPTTSSRYLNSTYYRVAAHKGALTVYANHTPYEYNVMLDFNTPNNEKVSINGKEISNTQLNVSNVLFDDYLDNLVVETEVIVDREYVASPTLKGYTFKGWSVNEDGSGTLLQANTRLNQSNLTNVFGSVPVNNSNLTLYAVWE